MHRNTLLALMAAIQMLFAALSVGCAAVDQASVSTNTTPGGGLQVHVKDPEGNPLPGAKVVSDTQPSGQLKTTGLTDGNGTVTFRGISLGDYEFYVSCAGYFQSTLALTVTGQDTSVTVTMTKQPVSTSTPVPTESAIRVTFLDLTNQPDRYNGRVVMVEGFWFDGFEIVTLAERLEPAGFAPGNVQPAGAKIWIKGGLSAEVSSHLYLQPNNPTGYPAHYGKVDITGTFQYGAKYGHLDSYQYQLIVLESKTRPWASTPAS